MDNQLVIYNTTSREKEKFSPITPSYVGMYVCGPTVYGEAHLGHARPAVTFDLLFRFLKYSGYKVRYVRNITDVGHLTNEEEGTGEDKIAKKAKLESLEPMEVVHHYTKTYHRCMDALNVLSPSIEPAASGHIIEQIDAVQNMIKNGYAYESKGSVYFDVEKYAANHDYGKLSGRKIEDLQNNTRALDGQNEKRSGLDFALWKNASPEHIMRWPSPWGDGFPGWHTECTAMGKKYLGERFDIHGGGMDLMFPHHEAEIAQAVACNGHETVNYWMHNNMVTINGQKMGKSLGNFINLSELFSGSHDLLEQAYSPMTIRFFMLQAHYRSPLDFSNEALQAAEKGLNRLMKAMETLETLKASKESTVDVAALSVKCFAALNDDLNSPILVAHLFDGVKAINSIADGKASIDVEGLETLKKLYSDLVYDILGLKNEAEAAGSNDEGALDKVMDLVLQLRVDAKTNKDWATADKIRDELRAAGITVTDTKDGTTWEVE